MVDIATSDYKVTMKLPVMNFYCWPCRSVHAFPLDDVERIVYALAIDAAAGWNDAHLPSGEENPECLLLVLESANKGDLHGTQVERAIECRQAHDG